MLYFLHTTYLPNDYIIGLRLLETRFALKKACLVQKTNHEVWAQWQFDDKIGFWMKIETLSTYTDMQVFRNTFLHVSICGGVSIGANLL